MPGIKRSDCPHCFIKSVAFVAVHQWKLVNGECRVLMACSSCLEGVIWAYLPGLVDDLTQAAGDLEARDTLFARQWPEAEAGEAPADTPENIANFFRQAVASLQAGSFDAAGIMFRKSLESGTKALNPTTADMKLVKRIEKLVADGVVTKDLGAWAHEVRLGGNDAAHEEEPFAEEDASSLREFTENFLTYAFTMPAAVARRSRKPKIS